MPRSFRWVVLVLVVSATRVAAQQRHPAEDKGIKSLDSKIPTVLALVNRTGQDVKVYWIDFAGKRSLRGTLPPGQRYDTNTFVTHPWLVTDAKENVLAIYLPDAQPRTVDIAAPAGRKMTATAAYGKRTIEGFTVLVGPELLARTKDADNAIAEMTRQLNAISRVVGTKPLVELRKVPIWLEWETFGASAAQFHPLHAAPWLEARGLNADKVGAVDINNARQFIDWSPKAQPWMVMHELAHAYHNLVLGAEHAGIRAAYAQAVERKLYESVRHVSGTTRKAYALTNDQEYFAELTEAYFGRNDFFPFDRRDLEKHDPVGYALMCDVWGPPQAKDK